MQFFQASKYPINPEQTLEKNVMWVVFFNILPLSQDSYTIFTGKFFLSLFLCLSPKLLASFWIPLEAALLQD